MRSAPRALVLGAMLGVALGACASPSHPSGTAPGGPASDPAGRPTYPTASASPLPRPSTSPSAPGTITGTVLQGAEPSCLILRTPQGDFELLTDRRVSAGDHVTATGQVTHVLSHCMQGTPFQVSTLTVR